MKAKYYDQKGELVKQELITADQGAVIRISVADLSRGVYILQIGNDTEIQSIKFIKE